MIYYTERPADHQGEGLPEHLAHAAVDDKIEGTGQAHEGVDEKNDLVGNLVVEESRPGQVEGVVDQLSAVDHVDLGVVPVQLVDDHLPVGDVVVDTVVAWCSRFGMSDLVFLF